MKKIGKIEDDLDGIREVRWYGKIYEKGNCRHNLCELWKNKKFIRIVDIKELEKVK